jgi:hypothetical protein
MKSRDLINATGMKDHRVYYAIGKLGLKRNAEGLYQVTALSAPDVQRGPNGRAAPGSGPALLRLALGSGPLPVAELKSILRGHGMSPKSLSGVMDRAKRDNLIKKVGEGYTLTAKAKANGEAHG